MHLQKTNVICLICDAHTRARQVPFLQNYGCYTTCNTKIQSGTKCSMHGVCYVHVYVTLHTYCNKT